MLAGIMAFAVLCLLCVFYYNIPVHITSKTGATDYAWEKHCSYSKMTEGVGYGRMNNEGFNNLADYNSGTPIDILLMGSSHMEATNVPQKKTTGTLMNAEFGNTNYVYNIGVSSHDFIHIASNLETAIQYYKPGKYVVIEISSIQFNTQSLENIITGNVYRLPSYDSNIIFFLQKIPYLRLLYFQYKNFIKEAENEEVQYVPDPGNNMEAYSNILASVVKKIYAVCAGSGVRPVIFYHPHLALRRDGSAAPETDAAYLGAFKNACAANNVAFLDMTDAFMEAYQNSRLLPHGFFNTAVGKGHLNKHGHKTIAQELYTYIMQEDAI